MNQLIIFFKEPVFGEVKTRLAKDVGFHFATAIYEEILYSLLRSVVRPEIYDVTYAVPSSTGKIFIQKLKNIHSFTEVIYQDEKSPTLGEKLKAVFKSHFSTSSEKHEKVIVIGGDCPFITPEDIQYSFNAMNKYDGVIGPSTDGGYYLIGLSNKQNIEKQLKLFQNIPWSTDQVLTKTKEVIDKLDFNFSFLKEKFDIDTKEDYERYLQHQ